MRSLFLRVFFSFWATIAVIIVGQHLLHLLYASQTGVPELLLSIAISGLPCLLIARSFATPIVRLRAATRRIAAGDLAGRLATAASQRRDEIGGLIADFDHMAERLQLASDAQKRLTADISHELRSPLARLGLALELARTRPPEEAARALDRIELEARRLDELIGKLLLMAALESDAGSIERTPVDLVRLVAEIVANSEFEARNMHRSVRLESSGSCVVSGDEDLLRSAIENVVRNAVRHTAEGTEVVVNLHRDEGDPSSRAIIEVVDRGPGVPEAELPRLFDPFYRIESARDRNSGGVGLGLSITQQAIRLHSGNVTARNLPEGGLAVVMEI